MDLFQHADFSKNWKEPTTSAEAAASNPGAKMRNRGLVLAALRDGPKTAHEIATATGLDINCVRPRITGLKDEGLVERVPKERGRTPLGESCAIWRVVLAEGGA